MGAMSGCRIGLVRRRAFAAKRGLRFEGLARSETRRWFRPGGGCYTARQSEFMPANAPEDALFESVP